MKHNPVNWDPGTHTHRSPFARGDEHYPSELSSPVHMPSEAADGKASSALIWIFVAIVWVG